MKNKRMPKGVTKCGVIALGFTFIVALAGCAPMPPVDVSKSGDLVRTTLAPQSRAKLSSVEIIDRATPSKLENEGVFGDTEVGVRQPTSQTVTEDIKAYFDKATIRESGSGQKVIVRIEKVDAYWVFRAAKKVPFVGLALLGTPDVFVMKLRASFEVESQGKVLRTFNYDETFSLANGSASTRDSIAESYQRLIALYRQRFFDDLDKQFAARYL